MGRSTAFFNPELSDILRDLAAAEKWTPTQAKDAMDWYSHFLELNWETPGNTVYMVSGRADKLWHEHINHTRRYREYCDACFGFYLDHDPVTRKLSPAEIKAARKPYLRWSNVIPDMIVPCVHG